ncbi:MAG: winged helix-turn-helix domain-containing protein [Bacteroides sp.]|nr:winged helix-turn-helix domain-containing protein [Bacteroides sp.]MBD5285770.1 winged helix-turn-helix domain-containing protein [Bacteroides sp.]
MNIDTIGYNAGLVWNALNDAEAMGLKQVKKATKLKDKELYAAIGWLAREGKLLIAENEDEKDLILSLAQ